MISELKTIFQYRQLLFALTMKSFKSKYKNSLLGIFWSLLNPLLNVLIFTFIFSVIIKINIKDYPLYLLCTILPWNFFNSAVSNSVGSIVEDGHVVKNTFFPYEAIPIAITIAHLINFLIDLLILLPILILFGRGVSIIWLHIPFLVFIEFVLTCALSIFMAGLYVLFRDLNFILNLSLRLFFYFVPVVYTLELVPKNLHYFYLLNPLAVIVDSFAKIFFYRITPDFKWLILASLESIIIFILCFIIFQRIKKIIPERL